MKYLYLFGTVLFTVYGQLIIKWRMDGKGHAPEKLWDKIIYLFHAYSDFWVISGFFSALLASFCWVLVITKFELSYAYPFMSGSFVLVFLLSILLFNETVTIYKLIGLLLIVAGIVVSSR